MNFLFKILNFQKNLNVIFIFNTWDNKACYPLPVRIGYHWHKQKRENDTSISNDSAKDIDGIANHQNNSKSKR